MIQDQQRRKQRKKYQVEKNKIKNNKLSLKKSIKKSNSDNDKKILPEIFSFLPFFKKEEKKESVQDTITYKRMLPNGICQIDDTHYSKTLEFFDINYQLAQNENKAFIFESYCEFLNYFDSSINFQLTFVNQKNDMSDLEENILIANKNDSFDHIREEYSTMLKNQLERGNNGIVKKKYITFTIESDNLKQARSRIEKIESDILNNFKVIGAKATSLTGKERLQILHNILNINPKNKFIFNWDMVKKGGMSTKDLICPSNFYFDRNIFRMGDYYCQANYMIIDSPEISDRLLADILDIDENIIITFHLNAYNQNVAIKKIKKKRTDLDNMKMEHQKKAIRAGYDMDILPPDLQTFSKETDELLDALQQRNERMFNTTIVILNTAKTREKLNDIVMQVKGALQKFNCTLQPLDYQQERAINTLLPLANNQIESSRMLTTTSTAVFVPFTTQELFMSGESLYYGLNALSNNMIMVDRKQLKNPNGLILGVPGSGKSFSAKREITNCFLITSDDIIVGDPEDEYSSLVDALNGQVINISPTSQDYINPLDINLNYSEDDDPITLKSDFILSLCELIVASKDGLKPEEKSIIDRCVRKIYQPYINNPIKENIPILQDLYDELLKIYKEDNNLHAKRIAASLELYVTGSMNLFNHQSNVDINNRFVCYNIKELGKQLKKLGMLVIQDQVWNRVSSNRGKKSTRYYIDEFHLLLKEEQTANYSVEIWKRFRKWGGIPTGITQNVKDLLSSREVENIFENSEFIYMLSQAGGDREILAKQLKISNHQLGYVTHSNPGEGLLFFGNVTIPFIDNFPKNTELYRVMTTDPKDL